MIRKLLIKLKTRFALKKDTLRGSDAYQSAKYFGVLYTLSDDKQINEVNDFLTSLKEDGKEVRTLVYIPKLKKGNVPSFSHFTDKDFSSLGKWVKEEVEEFKNESFDYLISLDSVINKFSKNILATSKSKCRVGRYEESTSSYFELMINHDGSNFPVFLQELYGYLKNVRNG